MTLNRRQLLGYGASALGLAAIGLPTVRIGAGGRTDHRLQRQPAVLGPDHRPLGGQPDHPGHLPVGVRPVHPAEAGPVLRARPAHRMGLERRQEARSTMTVREGVTWHDGSPFTAEDVVWSLRARRQRRDRQPDPVRLEERSATSRSTATRSPPTSAGFDPTLSSGCRSSPATSCRRPITRRSAPKASRPRRSAPAPTWSTSSSGTPSSG